MWRLLRAAFGVLAAASTLLLIWVLVDDGWSRMTVAFIFNVVAFSGMYLLARSRSLAS
jgi:hypothetical protein